MSVEALSCAAAVDAALRSLASAAYPNEGCGVMVGRLTAAGVVEVESVVAGRNRNLERARDRYDLDPDDIVRADREARARGLDVVGFWHSHPDHPAWPSQFDTDRAWVDYAYVICATTSEGTGDVNAFTLDGEGGAFLQVRLTVTPSAPAGG